MPCRTDECIVLFDRNSHSVVHKINVGTCVRSVAICGGYIAAAVGTVQSVSASAYSDVLLWELRSGVAIAPLKGFSSPTSI